MYVELFHHDFALVTSISLQRIRTTLLSFFSDGVCAVVEMADYNLDEDEATKSDLFTPLLLDVEMDAEDEVVGRRLIQKHL